MSSVLNHFVAPGGAGGAHSRSLIVYMQTGRHGHCMCLVIYGGTDDLEDTARLKSQGESPSVACVCLSLSILFSLALFSVAMSCLDVMYHQSYGAHYLPAAAYKATYYNHHHQQQQVRYSSLKFVATEGRTTA